MAVLVDCRQGGKRSEQRVAPSPPLSCAGPERSSQPPAAHRHRSTFPNTACIRGHSGRQRAARERLEQPARGRDSQPALALLACAAMRLSAAAAAAHLDVVVRRHCCCCCAPARELALSVPGEGRGERLSAGRRLLSLRFALCCWRGMAAAPHGGGEVTCRMALPGPAVARTGGPPSIST